MTAAVRPRPARLRREVAVLVTGTAAGQLAVVLSTPLVSRLFAPSEVGAFGAFSALESILVVVACLRFDQAVGLARSDDEARPLLRLAVASAVATSLLVALAALLAPSSWRSSLGVGSLHWLALLLGGTVLCDALGQALAGWSVRRRDLVGVARSRAVVGGAQAVGQVGAGVAGAGSGGLALGYLVGRAAGAAELVRRARRARGETELEHHAADLVARDPLPPMARWRYPALLAPAALLNAGALQVPILLVAARYGVATVGALVLANRLVSAPMQLAGQSITQALTGRFAQLRDPIEADVRPQVRSAIVHLGALGALVTAPILLAAPTVAAWGLGAEWRVAGQYAQVLAPSMALQLVAAPVAIVLALKARQGLQLAWDASRLVAVVAAILAPSWLGWSPLAAITCLGVVLALAYVVLLGLVWQVARPGGR